MIAVRAVVILSLGVSGIFASLYHLQMLQQNGYYPSRYIRWLKKSFSPKFSVAVAAAAIWVVICFLPRGVARVLLPAASALTLLRIPIAVNKQKKSVKRLVFTSRVKRLAAGEAAIYLALFALSFAVPERAALIAAAAVSFFPSVPVLAAWGLLYPAERCVYRRYVNDARRRLRGMPGLTVIGVTGSYGKTGTKNMLGRMLGEKYNTLITPESYNTPMGVVKTVRGSLTPETQIFVCEMGARNPGDIKKLCEIVDPDIGIITSVGPQHLETFGSIENVLATKLELADWILAKGGRVYINGDNGYLRTVAGRAGVVTYGESGDCDCKIASVTASKEGAALTLEKGGAEIKLETKLLGRHNALNLAGAAAAALDLRVPESGVKYAASTLKPVPHRLEPKPYSGGSLLIDDAYNSNPEGAAEAMRVLGTFGGMKKIAVTPGLVELGKDEYAYNRRLGEQAAAVCDILILVGETRAVPIKEGALAAGFDGEKIHIVPTFMKAAELLRTLCDGNTAVLIENDLPDVYV